MMRTIHNLTDIELEERPGRISYWEARPKRAIQVIGAVLISIAPLAIGFVSINWSVVAEVLPPGMAPSIAIFSFLFGGFLLLSIPFYWRRSMLPLDVDREGVKIRSAPGTLCDFQCDTTIQIVSLPAGGDAPQRYIVVAETLGSKFEFPLLSFDHRAEAERAAELIRSVV